MRSAKRNTRSMSCSISTIVTSRGSCCDRLEQLAALAGGHAGGRLVEQQHARARRERQRDLDQALLAVGEVAACARSRRRPACRRASSSRRLVDRLAMRADRLPPAPPRCRCRSHTASVTDSSTVMSANRRLIWNVRARPRLTRWCCGSEVTSSPPRITLPDGGLQEAGQQVDERRLAGAVGADQRVAAPAVDVERDVVGGDEAAEFLDEIARGSA